jgi:hypothetical protein
VILLAAFAAYLAFVLVLVAALVMAASKPAPSPLAPRAEDVKQPGTVMPGLDNPASLRSA